MTTLNDIYNALIAASLPIESVVSNATGGYSIYWQHVPVSRSQLQQGSDILLQFTSPEDYSALLAFRVDMQTIREKYGETIDRQEQIINSGTIAFTVQGFNQVVKAVQDLALFQERHYRFDAERVTSGIGGAISQRL